MWLYGLFSESTGRCYVGITNKIATRLAQHNGQKRGGAKETSKGRPWRPMFVIGPFPNRSVALALEGSLHSNAFSPKWPCRHTLPEILCEYCELLRTLQCTLSVPRWSMNSPLSKDVPLTVYILHSLETVSELVWSRQHSFPSHIKVVDVTSHGFLEMASFISTNVDRFDLSQTITEESGVSGCTTDAMPRRPITRSQQQKSPVSSLEENSSSDEGQAKSRRSRSKKRKNSPPTPTTDFEENEEEEEEEKEEEEEEKEEEEEEEEEEEVKIVFERKRDPMTGKFVAATSDRPKGNKRGKNKK